MTRNLVLPALAAALLLSIAVASCGDCAGNIGGDDASGPEDAGEADASGPGADAATPADAGVLPDGGIVLADGGCVPLACQNKVLLCADCLDNDGDGKIDAADPDCLGPCQNNESGFAGDIPGQNNAPCKQDCYFDKDTGTGNDDCQWDHGCDSRYPDPEPGCTQVTPGGAECPPTQSALCKQVCLPLAPNGCDCFGCCTTPRLDGGYFWVGSYSGGGGNRTYTCALGDELDLAKCRPCTPVGDCLNGCGRCEICVGKPVPDPSCFPDGGVVVGDGGAPPDDGGAQCPAGVQPCGLPGQAPCPANFFCITGCCRQIN